MTELLGVYNLVKLFPVRRGLLRSRREYVHAVDGISFSVDAEQTMGLVGESGCGKSTAGRSILRLIRPTAGEVRFKGENLLSMDSRQERQMRAADADDLSRPIRVAQSAPDRGANRRRAFVDPPGGKRPRAAGSGGRNPAYRRPAARAHEAVPTRIFRGVSDSAS